MPFGFVGRNILITGAERGIGRALAIAVVKAGGEVYALSREQAHLDSLEKDYSGIKPIHCDLSDWDIARAELEKVGPIDGLVNSASFAIGGHSALTASKEILDKTLAVNLYAAINTMQVVGKKMENAGKGGSIVNVSSIPVRGCPQYNISKAALNMATKQFALELGPQKIRVNSVYTISVTKDMASDMAREDLAYAGKMCEMTALKKIPEMHEIVAPILYLLSDHSSMVTGITHLVEGGMKSNLSV